MAEPVSPAASAVAAGVSSGLLGALFVPLGLTWPLVLWASLGCVVGLSWAPKVGRLRAASLFGAAALLSALFGKIGAAHFGGGIDLAQGLAAVLGIVFHPLLTAVVDKLPGAVASVIPRGSP